MKADQQGCSTVQPGQELFEKFKGHGHRFVQYDFRTDAGVLFSCVAKSLKAARAKRDSWMKKQQTITG